MSMTGPTLILFTHSNKAVAVGAVSFYVDHFVTGRIAKFTFGVPSHVRYRPFDPEHVRREHKLSLDPTGDKRIPGHFETMLTRVCHPPRSFDPPGQFHCVTGHQGSGGP